MLLNSIVDDFKNVSVCFTDQSTGIVDFPSFFTRVDESDRLTLLYFYPGDYTSICATEVLAFHAAHAEFEKRGVTVVGCSVNGPEVHAAWQRTPKINGGLGTCINHCVLSDIARELAKYFDVLIPTRNVATRATFILDKSGRVLYETRSDTKTARDVRNVLHVVDDIRRNAASSKRDRE